MMTRDTTRRCFICTELGHLAKTYINTGRIEDEKKAKGDNIRKKRRQKWISKSSENASSRNEAHITQELGDSNIYT